MVTVHKALDTLRLLNGNDTTTGSASGARWLVKALACLLAFAALPRNQAIANGDGT